MNLFDISSISWSRILIVAVPYILGLAVAIFLIAGGILDYHWRTYGVGLVRLFMFRAIYVSAGIILLAVMSIAYSSL
jgi:hypothetical protein